MTAPPWPEGGAGTRTDVSPHAVWAGLRARLRGLRYGFLLVPGGGVALSIVGAFLLLAADRHLRGSEADFGVSGDPAAARTVLTAIAGSLITVAGVTFSLTMITLQLVSQQFSPRALGEFLGDRLTQAVAGAFTGVFVFCLLILRTVESREEGTETFVPALSVTAAIVLAVGCLLLLLVFIDHLGRKIQVSTIAGGIARTTLGVVDELQPVPFGEGPDEDPAPLLRAWRAERDAVPVHPHRPGYVQAVDLDALVRAAAQAGERIELRASPGDFVTEADVLAGVWPGAEDGDAEHAVRQAVVLADERDVQRDPGYGVRQLADIAARAISPGINDQTTAWTCVHYLRAILERLAVRDLPERVHRQDDGVVVVARHEFADFVDAGFVQLGRHAADPRVAAVLLECLGSVSACAAQAGARERVDIVRAAARGIGELVLGERLSTADREHLQALVARATAEPPAEGR